MLRSSIRRAPDLLHPLFRTSPKLRSKTSGDLSNLTEETGNPRDSPLPTNLSNKTSTTVSLPRFPTPVPPPTLSAPPIPPLLPSVVPQMTFHLIRPNSDTPSPTPRPPETPRNLSSSGTSVCPLYPPCQVKPLLTQITCLFVYLEVCGLTVYLPLTPLQTLNSEDQEMYV